MNHSYTINSINYLFWLLVGGVLVSLIHEPLVAQEHTVNGSVISSIEGEALPTVNIVVKGTEIGTTTDLNGNYSITTPSQNDTLVFSFIGYETLEEPINGRSVVDVALTGQAITGEELVVIGYGSVERRDITGAVSSISSRDIQEVPVTDAAQALQGRASGVMALSAGNRPGQGVTVYVRGRRSLTASNDPLYVVDGIPLEGGLNDINPRDIESMELLKDASATAIYGSRGANGVVLITTNRGGNHDTRVSYSAHTGIRTELGRPDMMTGSEYAAMKEAADREFTPAELDAIDRGVSVDWIDEVLEEGFQQNHQLSVQGGNESTQFSVSGNYFYDKGVITSQDFTRNTFRLNLDHNISDRFRIGTSTQLSRQFHNWGSNPYGGALAMNPLAEPRDENGDLVLRPGADPLLVNPLKDLVDGAYLDERERIRIFSNIFADLDILENLNYRMNLGPDFQDYRRGLFQGSETGARNGNPALARKEHIRNITYTFENILTWSQDFDIHSVDLTGLYSIQESRREFSDIEASDLPYESQQYHNLGTGSTVEDFGSDLDEWGLMSYMLRANYQLMDRYLFTVTGRYDGSSRLAEGDKWGFFPSVAVGWRISSEPFMADQNLFSDLRLRASYGITGNTAIDPYQTRGGLGRTIYSFNDGSGFGYRPSDLANPDLQWEESETINLGLDFGLWEDRVAGSFEIYQINTSNLLLERAIPVTSGFTSVLENIGETQNRGFEVSLTTNNIATADFSWTTTINAFSNSEEILELYGTGEDDVGNRWFIGEPLTVWYDYDMLGIWQENEADQADQFGRSPGEIKLRDVNGDGSITEEDRVVIGSDIPKLTGGIGNRFRYKNFDLSIFLTGSFGHTISNNFLVANSSLQGRYNNLDVDYWTPENPSNTTPKPDGSREFPLNSSARGYVKGDFLKVRNVQLGYDLPVSLMENIGIRSARFYVNAENLFVFSHLDGSLDPEVFDTSIDNDTGRMFGGQLDARLGPATRLFTIGTVINF